MRHTMGFGIAAGLALAASAWAGKNSSDEKAVRGSSRASVQARTGAATGQRPGAVVVSSYKPMEARSARSSEVRAFSQARWVQEREGYRDGGY